MLLKKVHNYFKEKVFICYKALSNDVFIVETEKGKFVLKKIELGIAELIGAPRIVSNENNVMILEYIEHRNANLDEIG